MEHAIIKCKNRDEAKEKCPWATVITKANGEKNTYYCYDSEFYKLMMGTQYSLELDSLEMHKKHAKECNEEIKALENQKKEVMDRIKRSKKIIRNCEKFFNDGR